MLRSLPSDDKAYVSFRNRTERDAAIIWYDFQGRPVVYNVLHVGQFQDINTYKHHPWISIDYQTGAKLLLNYEPVFYPVSVREIHEGLQFVRIPLRSLGCRRSEVSITLPMFSLCELSQQKVYQCLKDVDDIQKLMLPQTLREDLRRLHANKMSLLQT